MKKLVVLLLTTCYLLVTTGVVTVSHYCMDRLAAVSFYGGATENCGKCGMAKKAHSCCEDQAAFSKITTGHYMATAPDIDWKSTGTEALLSTPYLLAPLENGNRFAAGFPPDPPPLLTANPIYLRNQVFRI